MAILGTVFFGIIFLAGVAVLIGALSTNKEHSRMEKDLSLIVKNKGDVMIVEKNGSAFLEAPNGRQMEIPKKFDPHLIMDQLGELQGSPNVIKSYLVYLINSFQSGIERKFLEKIMKYYEVLASTTASQEQVIAAQRKLFQTKMEFDIDLDTADEMKQLIKEDRILEKQESIAQRKARIAGFSASTERVNQESRSKDPFDKAKRSMDNRIKNITGKQASVREFRQEYEAKVSNILRGRTREQLSQYEKEEVLKLDKEYYEVMEEL